MALKYLAGGESPTAAKMNELFAELDSKLSKLLSAKTFLLELNNLSAVISALLSRKTFFFISGKLAYANLIPGFIPKPGVSFEGLSYDHSLFSEAAASLTEISRDDSNRILKVQSPSDSFYDRIGISTNRNLLDFSLEAHTKKIDGKTYYLQPANATWPEKLYDYALAEIIIEGPELVIFKTEWDKYKCFRIHNLGRKKASVEFEGGNKKVELEPFGCASIRRSTANVVYTPGHTYFQKFITGKDWRFYRAIDLSAGNVSTQDSPMFAMAANNLSNPAILYDFIRIFAAKINLAYWLLHQHEVYDVYPKYSALFGDPAKPETLLGDLVHHRGKFKVAKTDSDGVIFSDGEFKGYQTIASDLLAAGIAMSEDVDGDLQLKSNDSSKQVDFVSLGTNLLKSGEGINSIVNVDADRKIEKDLIFETTLGNGKFLKFIRPPALISKSEQKFHIEAAEENELGDPIVGTGRDRFTTGTFAELSTSFDSSESKLSLHKSTLGELISLASFGALNSDFGTFEESKANLTGAGLVLTWKEKVPAKYIFDAFDADWEIETDQYLKRDLFNLSSHGWPDVYSLEPARTAFLSPRIGRYISQLNALTENNATAFISADWINEISGPGGSDFSVADLNATPNEIKILRRLDATINPRKDGRFQVFDLPDVLDIFIQNYLTPGWYSKFRTRLIANQKLGAADDTQRFLRMPLLQEHWNNMAWTVNRIKSGKPLSFAAIQVFVSGFDDLGNKFEKIEKLKSNTSGLHESTIRPKNQFARLQTASEKSMARELGISIKTIADLPASYQNIKGTKAKIWTAATHFAAKLTNILVSPHPDIAGVVRKTGDQTNVFLRIASPTIREATADDFIVGTDLSEGLLGLDRQALFGNLNASDRTFDWITVEDAQVACEALGLSFIFERLITPLTLQIVDLANVVEKFFSKRQRSFGNVLLGDFDRFNTAGPLPGLGVHADEQYFAQNTLALRANHARFFHARTEAETDFVKDDLAAVPTDIWNYPTEDISGFRIASTGGILQGDFPYSFEIITSISRSTALLSKNLLSVCFETVFSDRFLEDKHKGYSSAAYLSNVSAGINRDQKMLLVSLHWWTQKQKWSNLGYNEFNTQLSRPDEFRPWTFNSSTLVPKTLTLDKDFTLLDVSDVDAQKKYRIVNQSPFRIAL